MLIWYVEEHFARLYKRTSFNETIISIRLLEQNGTRDKYRDLNINSC